MMEVKIDRHHNSMLLVTFKYFKYYLKYLGKTLKWILIDTS